MKLVSLHLIATLSPVILANTTSNKQSEIIQQKIIPDLQYDDYEIDPECLPDFQANELGNEIQISDENLQKILEASESTEVKVGSDSNLSNVNGFDINGNPVSEFDGRNKNDPETKTL